MDNTRKGYDKCFYSGKILMQNRFW